MALSETVYEAALVASRPALGMAALMNDSASRAVRGRRDALRRFESWGAEERDPSRPLAWFHAPSVGEGLMAQAIIAAVRRARPDAQIAFTQFSPSADRIAGAVGADVHGYLPWDTRGAVRRALAALRPAVIAFVRTEVWPVLTREAKAVGTGLVLVNAVVSEDSGRLSGVGRRFLGPTYQRLDTLGAVSEPHAGRYALLGVPHEAIRVTGDARFDQVWARVADRPAAELRAGGGIERLPQPVRPIFRLLRDPERFTVVAGSTWESDDAVLLPAIATLHRAMPLLLVVAPHEPTDAHLRSLERTLDRQGLRHSRIGALLAAAGATAAAGVRVPEVVIIDRLGVLADLYALGDAAYVGGGFRPAGLHSIVEPAALGVPVLFGPGHANASEAGELAAAGGGFVVNGAAAAESVFHWLAEEPAARREAGEAARSFVRAQTGAAERNAALVVARFPGNDRASGV